MGQYPMQACHFIVEWGGERLGFTEVSGLEISTDVVEYREGSDPTHRRIRCPDLESLQTLH